MPSIAILGGGPGIAMGVARAFGREGYHVALLARSARAGELAGQLAGEGLQAHAVRLDVAHAHDVQAALHEVARIGGDVEVLLYNAAAFTPATPTHLPPDQLTADLGVGVTGALAAVQAVQSRMAHAGGGTILFTGGGYADYPSAQMTALSVQKAAIRALAACVAEELQPKGIRVATLTVNGVVKPGTPFDPDLIGEAYLALHRDRAGALGTVVPFRGGALAG